MITENLKPPIIFCLILYLPKSFECVQNQLDAKQSSDIRTEALSGFSNSVCAAVEPSPVGVLVMCLQIGDR